MEGLGAGETLHVGEVMHPEAFEHGQGAVGGFFGRDGLSPLPFGDLAERLAHGAHQLLVLSAAVFGDAGMRPRRAAEGVPDPGAAGVEQDGGEIRRDDGHDARLGGGFADVGEPLHPGVILVAEGAGGFGQQVVLAAEMQVHHAAREPGAADDVGDGGFGQADLGDGVEGGVDQRLSAAFGIAPGHFPFRSVLHGNTPCLHRGWPGKSPGHSEIDTAAGLSQ